MRPRQSALERMLHVFAFKGRKIRDTFRLFDSSRNASSKRYYFEVHKPELLISL